MSIEENWYLQSSHRGGGHFGRLEDGTVRARCGVEFAPQIGLFGGGAAVATLPMQDGQGCRACCDQLGVPVEAVEAPRPNHVRHDHQVPPGVMLVRRQPGATALSLVPTALPLALTPPPAPVPPPASPAAQQPPAPAAPPAAAKVIGKSWFRRSTNRADTHWVVTISRGTKTAACGATFQGRRAKAPTLDQICPTCNERRSR